MKCQIAYNFCNKVCNAIAQFLQSCMNVSGKKLADELDNNDDNHNEFSNIKNYREQDHVEKTQPCAFLFDIFFGFFLYHDSLPFKTLFRPCRTGISDLRRWGEKCPNARGYFVKIITGLKMKSGLSVGIV